MDDCEVCIMYLIFETLVEHNLVNRKVNAYLGYSGIGTDTWCHGLRCGELYAMPIHEKMIGALNENELAAIVYALPEEVENETY